MRVARAIVLFTTAGIVHAQAPPQVAFEVASVKRNTSGDSKMYFQVPPSGTVNLVNATVRMIVREAYQIDPAMERYTLVIGSNSPLVRGESIQEQMSAPRFDIQGKPPADAAAGTQHAMLRTVLAERFKLRVHTETRSLPVDALTVVRQGQPRPGSSSVDRRLRRLFRAQRARGTRVSRSRKAAMAVRCAPAHTIFRSLAPRDFRSGGHDQPRSCG